MKRPPDARAGAGQSIEDEHDAIAEEVRRRTTGWVAQMRRPNPNSARLHGSILAGIGTGLLDQLWQQQNGNEESMRLGWQAWLEDYLDQAREDEAADKQEVSDAP